jgi:hypothetical protein
VYAVPVHRALVATVAAAGAVAFAGAAVASSHDTTSTRPATVRHDVTPVIGPQAPVLAGGAFQR